MAKKNTQSVGQVEPMDRVSMDRYIVTVHRIPTNYNDPQSFVVEAGSEKDARAIVRDNLRDFGPYSMYTYAVRGYTPPPRGKILGMCS